MFVTLAPTMTPIVELLLLVALIPIYFVLNPIRGSQWRCWPYRLHVATFAAFWLFAAVRIAGKFMQ